MNRLDTIKVGVSDALRFLEVNQSHWYHDFSNNPTNPKDTLILNDDARPVGISRVQYRQDSGELVLECSAKILGNKYHEGINPNTIEMIKDKLSILDAFKLKGHWLDDAKLYKVDVAHNIKPRDVSKSLTNLELFSMNRLYNMHRYSNGNILFKGNAESNKFQLLFYNKYEDLKLKKNSNFIDTVGSKYRDQHIGVLRIERKITKYSDIRKAFRTYKFEKPTKNKTEILFLDVLQSQEKVILNSIDDVTRIQLPLFSTNAMYSDMRWSDFVKRIGWETIVRQCDYDEKAVYSMIKQHTSKNSNISAYKREVREMIAIVKNYDSSNNVHDVLNEIKELLKAS